MALATSLSITFEWIAVQLNILNLVTIVAGEINTLTLSNECVSVCTLTERTSDLDSLSAGVFDKNGVDVSAHVDALSSDYYFRIEHLE